MYTQIVLLAGEDPSSNMVYHALVREFGGVSVILEERGSRQELFRRRVKKLGIATALGQVLFVLLARPALRRSGARRIDAIKQDFGLDDSPIDGSVIRVPSVNSPEARQSLQRLDPRVVVVNGTRIISPETLASTTAPFINMHAGITPLYRGVHGGYWALAEGRPDLAGTTVHLIDRGIDTGAVIAQATFSVIREDSFATYPYLHTAVGVPLLLDAIRQALGGQLAARKNPKKLPSALRTHPTLWGYLLRRITKGVL